MGLRARSISQSEPHSSSGESLGTRLPSRLTHIRHYLVSDRMPTEFQKRLKTAAATAIDSNKQDLYEVSAEIWKNPELCYEEYKAHELLTNFLEKKGFTVERSYTGIKTAFRATFGSGRPNICVVCEYDALPEIGHACGHNLIAEAGAAAGLGLKAVLESSGAPEGRVTVLGTPAEEGGAGKVYLIENGAFEDIDIAMMVHPAPFTSLMPPYLACIIYEAEYTGKAAHAAAFPWEGVNALDAAVMAYTSISVLRQQMKPTWRVHGVIKHGGVKPNIIPDRTLLEYMVRTDKKSELPILSEKVKACIESAAIATGCKVELRQTSKVYDPLLTNEIMAKLYGENLKDFEVAYRESGGPGGGTDMGNVSHVVPSLHPKFAVGSGKEVNHSVAFTRVANSAGAHNQMLIAAKAMAYTGVDVLTTEGLLEEIKARFQKDISTCTDV